MQVRGLGVTKENKEKPALSSSFHPFTQTKVKLPFECHYRRANNAAFMFQGSSFFLIRSFQLQLRKAVVPIISKRKIPCFCSPSDGCPVVPSSISCSVSGGASETADCEGVLL